MKEHRVMAIEKEQFDTNRELKNFKSVQTMQQSCHRVQFMSARENQKFF